MELVLERGADVGDVGFGGIVHERHECDVMRYEATDHMAVLGDGVEPADVTGESAEVGQRVRDVFYADVVGVGFKQVEGPAGVGGDGGVQSFSSGIVYFDFPQLHCLSSILIPCVSCTF